MRPFPPGRGVSRRRALAALMGAIGLVDATLRGESPRRILYVNSYHRGYPPSDEVEDALVAGARDARVAVDVVRLDAKRAAEAVVRAHAERVRDAVRARPPEVLVVSDDPAVKWLVAPYFSRGPVPVVFCGVNWDASPYGLPTPFVTGMVEVVPVEDALEVIRRVRPATRRLAVVSERSVSEDANRAYLEPRLRAAGFDPTFHMAETFTQWRDAMRAVAGTADVVYLPTNGAIERWDWQAAIQQVVDTGVATFTCDDFMMPCAAFGLTKVASEQGEWAARTALEILAGRPAAAVPVTRNRQVRAFWNPRLAARLGIDVPADVKQTAREVG